MKKMIIVMSSLYNGGAERSLVNMLNELPRDRYEIDILLLKRSGMFLKQVPANINVLETPKDIKRLYGPLLYSGIVLPIRVIGNVISRLCTTNSRERRGFRWKYFYGPMIKPKKKHYDVALAYISGEILYLVDEKIFADKKVVWIHNDYRSAQHPRKYDYPHLKNMNAVVSISESCVNILKEEFPEFSDKIYMLENITSSVIVKNRADEFIPDEYNIEGAKILSIGRLHEQKGFDFAIEAAEKLKKQGVKFTWFIIGSGELQCKLNDMIERKKLNAYVKLLGAKENPYPYIKNCDIFVQTSRYEGKSVVLDETKILAKPILATAYPTVRDQLLDGEEGIIVDMNSSAIAEGISSFLENKTLQKHIQQYLASKEYGNQVEIDKYINLIENI